MIQNFTEAWLVRIRCRHIINVMAAVPGESYCT